MNSEQCYQSDSDSDTYYSYENNESEYEYEEEQEEENVMSYDPEDDYYDYSQPEVVDIKTVKEKIIPKSYPAPVINPWTKIKNDEKQSSSTEVKSFLDILKEEEILKKERDEAEMKRKEKEKLNEKYRNSKRSGNRRHFGDRRSFPKSSNFSNDRPVQSLLLSHKMNTQKRGLKE